MLLRLTQIKLKPDDCCLTPAEIAARALRIPQKDILSARPVRRSIDARDKSDVRVIMALDVETARPIRPCRKTRRRCRRRNPFRHLRSATATTARWWWAWAPRGCLRR